MKELTHYIGGEHVKGTSGRFSDVYNPATGEVQAKCPLASTEEFGKAVGADAYCRDAAVAVETAKDFMKRKHNVRASA